MEEPNLMTEAPQFAFKKRNSKSKTTFRKRAATPPPASESDSGFTSSEDEEGRQIKRRRNNAGVTASSKSNGPTKRAEESSASSAVRPIPSTSNDATKTLDWYDEHPEAFPRSKILAQQKDVQPSESDGTYKGVANYQSFIHKNPDRAAKQVGPVKGSSNVRTITVTDYAPDVCKDYKQTGFCGFGDSCKFLHAREDYKQGWEQDRDWEINAKGKKITGKTVASANRSGQVANEEEGEDAMLENIPFACIICKKAYTSPIVTRCGHYFCEACAIKRYRKNPSCAACGSGTGGVFNEAKKLNRLLEKKRERAKKRRELALENGESVSEAEEEEEGLDGSSR